MRINDGLLTGLQYAGCGTVQQTKLFIRPDGLNRLRVRNADARVAAELAPVRGAFDTELGEDRVDSVRETRNLLDIVTGSDGEPETLLTACDGRVVDRLHVDIVLFQQGVGRDPCKSSVANEDGDDVGRPRNDGDVEGLKPGLEIAYIDLLELAVAVILLLV